MSMLIHLACEAGLLLLGYYFGWSHARRPVRERDSDWHACDALVMGPENRFDRCDLMQGHKGECATFIRGRQ